MSELAIQEYLARIGSDHFIPAWLTQGASLQFPHASDAHYSIGLADSLDDLREAQRLRYDIFKAEYGAQFHGGIQGIDSDEFDHYCDHLIVRCQETQEVVGTYRMLLPSQARRIGRYYSQSEFFMTRMERQLSDMIELGRSCVHPDHRNGTVIMLLWSAIIRYARHHGCQHLVGCASVSMRDGGSQALALWHQVKQSAMVDPMLEAFPKTPLPLDQIRPASQLDMPPLIRGYLRLGAKVCGEPSWDPDFNTADFLILMDLSVIPPRYARHFGV